MSADAQKRLRDGEAMDQMLTESDRWAKRYKITGDEHDWVAAFDAHHEPIATRLAMQSTQEARPFTARDWVLAAFVWVLMGMIVFAGSVILMNLQGTLTIIFGVFAVLVAIVGLIATYFETASPARAERRFQRKREWLMRTSRNSAIDIVRSRASAATTPKE